MFNVSGKRNQSIKTSSPSEFCSKTIQFVKGRQTFKWKLWVCLAYKTFLAKYILI
jgi:hypothetical protein